MDPNHGQQGPPSIEQLKANGPPYPPQGAGVGGVPTKAVDVPICSVLIALYVGSAAINMTIFQINRRRGHKFVLSALLFGFSMARIMTNVMRIVWAVYPTNVRVAIAANILTNAGVLLLFIVNLILAQRILRAYHPHIGWSKPASLAFRFLYVAVVLCLVMVIIATVYSFYTLDMHIRSQMRDVQLTAVVFLTVLAFLPLPIIITALLLPRKAPMDKFGQGRMRTKVILVLLTSSLLALGAGFRAGTAFILRPANDPAWFDHRAAFYCFDFVIELIVVYTYALLRFDKRFHVPDGSSAPGHYSRGVEFEKTPGLSGGLNADEEALGDSERPRTVTEQREQERAWESRLQDELEKREP